MQEILSFIHRLHHVENVIRYEVERYSSQYENGEAESHVSSDQGEFVDLIYYEEASCEDNDESAKSSQEEDSGSTCFSSCESDANFEEESNDRSEYSYVSKGMSSSSKSESEVSFQNYANQLKVDGCYEELSTLYED